MRRYSDVWTRTHRDDLVQEATIAAWRWARAPHDPARFWAAVRTIARRLRYKALDRGHRLAEVTALLPAAAEPGCRDERAYHVAGRCVPAHWLRPCLQRVLERLDPLDRQLLLGFHEGFCCEELAERFERTPECVKTRIHRARRRVQRELEACVRAADSLDV